MSLPTAFSLAYYIAFAVYFFLGLHVLSLNPKSTVHRIFFYFCLFLSEWAFSFCIVASADSCEMAKTWLRVSSVGWGAFFSIMLHFFMIMTEKEELLRKNMWMYFLIYLPAAVTVFVFGFISSTADKLYNIVRTNAGWIYIPTNTIWDWYFISYYTIFSISSIVLIFRYGLKTKDPNKKKQSFLLGASTVFVVLSGTFVDIITSAYSAYHVPQLSPIIVLIPILVIVYCIKKYGLLLPDRIKDEAEEGQLLSEAARTKLNRYLTHAYLLAAIVNFGFRFFTSRENLYSIMLSSSVMLGLGVALHLIQGLRFSAKLKETLSYIIIAASIPLIMLRYIDDAAIYAWIVPVCLVLMSVAFGRKRMLVIVGISTFLTFALLYYLAPETVQVINKTDHYVRMIIFSLILWLAFYINRIYRQRLSENEAQVRLQKLLAQISASFVTSNDGNIGVKADEMLRLCGEHFGADRTHLMFFDGGAMEHSYEWCGAGADSIQGSLSSMNLSKFTAWMDEKKLLRLDNICISDVDGLDDAGGGKKWLQDMKVKSLLVYPLRNNDKITGFMSIESLSKIMVWKESQLDTLKVLSNIISDVWSKSEAEKEVNYRAYYDSLTGLPNRDLFSRRLQQDISMAIRAQRLVGVAFIDIDSFKEVNDTIGHDGGDSLLIQLGRRLSGCVRIYDTVARYGGDEFIVIIPQIIRLEDMKRVADHIMSAFGKPLTVKGQEFSVTASMGISVFPIDGENIDDLIKNADLAMYASKQMGKNRYTLCSPEMKSDFIINMELTNSLYRALDRNELLLYYQPQMNCKTGGMTGVEALLRWNHPQKGIVPPGVFIPIAEKTGLINPIGQWAIYEACRKNKEWQEQGLPPMRMAVNLSLGQFRNPNLFDIVAGALKETGLDPQYLELEVTESAASHDINFVIATFKKLKELGVTVTIDDFGTEYSSLSRLKSLPIDRIKIDMQFIHGISNGDDKDEGIVKVILRLGKTLGLRVLAEGVEDQQQLRFLRENSCDEIQGYYYYRPLPAENIEPILKELSARPKSANSRKPQRSAGARAHRAPDDTPANAPEKELDKPAL